MELIQNFGIDPKLLGAQIVNFLIILYFLRRFLYAPILKLLENRKKTIADGLIKAEQARVLLEKTVEKEKQIRKIAQEEAKQLLNEAKNQRGRLLQETEESVKKLTETMLAQAREQIASDTKEAEKRLSSHISRLAMMFLQKSLSGMFSEKEQEVVIKNLTQKMKGEIN